MNDKDMKIFAASLGADIPSLDLHGFYPSEALEKLELFLFDLYKGKNKTARVIYGGGTGKLRQAVLDYLKKHPLVEDVTEEGGSCVVIF